MMHIRQINKRGIYNILGFRFIIGQVLTNIILNILIQTIEVWNNKLHRNIAIRSCIKYCFIFLLLFHLLPAALAHQQPHDLLSSHLAPQAVCAHLPSNLQHHDLLDLQAFGEEHLHRHLSTANEHQGFNLCHHSQVTLHQLAFPLHTQHLLCQHHTSWSSMSPSSTYHHHNDATTHPPPSELKIIQGGFPEASPKPQRHLGLAGCICLMQWVQSQFASLPADIEAEELTSAMASTAQRHQKQTPIEKKLTSAWASKPRVCRQQTSQEEKLTSAVAIEPSQPSRHRRRRVDNTLALMKGIIASKHRREEVDISAQTKGIMDSRHRSREVDISKWHRSIALHRCHASSGFTLHHQVLVWQLLWVHQYTARNVPAFLHPLLACQCHKRALQSRALHLDLLARQALAQQAGDHHLLSQQHRQHRMGSRDPLSFQHRHGHLGHLWHSLQKGHLSSGGFILTGDSSQHFSVHRHHPSTGPGHLQHLLRTMGGQQPRHHSRHLSCHCTTHPCHCFRLSHRHPHHNDHCNHLLHHPTGNGAQQSNIIIHQHPTLNTQHTTIHIQHLHPSVAAQHLAQRSAIIVESLSDIGSCQGDFGRVSFSSTLPSPG